MDGVIYLKILFIQNLNRKMVAFGEHTEQKKQKIHYCLMRCIKGEYIGDPEKDIELIVAQAVYNELGVKGGFPTYADWVCKYYSNTVEGSQMTWKTLKSEKGKDRVTIDAIVKLAQPFDETGQLADEVTDEDDYARIKTQFELTHFQAGDTFMQIYNKSLRPFTKTGFYTKYEHMRYGKSEEFFMNRWLKDADKRRYEQVDFLPPPLPVPDTVFNTWDVSASDFSNVEIDESVDTSVFHEFFHKITNCGSMGYDYLIKYVAHLIQFPSEKPHVGLFFTSSQGSGKDTLVKLINKLLGNSFTSFVNDPDHVFGKFNIQFRLNKLLVVLQEADNLKHYSNKIKDLITCETTNLAEKGVKAMTVRDFSRLFVFSNDQNIIKIEPDDRRWVVFKCYNFKRSPNPTFFERLLTAIENIEVVSRFRQELLAVECAGINFQAIRPDTGIYHDLKAANTPTIIRWAFTLCNPIFVEEELVKPPEFMSSELCAHYNSWCAQNFENNSVVSINSFGLAIKKYFHINDEWLGFHKRTTMKGSIFTYNRDELYKIITEEYGYTEDI